MSTEARRGGDFSILKYNAPIQKFNPIVLLRGIIFGISKDHCLDLLHYVNTSQTLWRLYYSRT